MGLLKRDISRPTIHRKHVKVLTYRVILIPVITNARYERYDANGRRYALRHWWFTIQLKAVRDAFAPGKMVTVAVRGIGEDCGSALAHRVAGLRVVLDGHLNGTSTDYALQGIREFSNIFNLPTLQRFFTDTVHARDSDSRLRPSCNSRWLTFSHVIIIAAYMVYFY